MKIKTLITACIILVTATSEARFVGIWWYQRLTKESDFIAFVEISSPTEETGEVVKKQKTELLVCSTTFKVLSTLKGDKKLKEIKLHHYKFPNYYFGRDIIMVSPYQFKRFPKWDESAYLAFLKTGKDGQFEPTAGQWDLPFSFYKLPMDADTRSEKILSKSGKPFDFQPPRIKQTYQLREGDEKLLMKSYLTKETKKSSPATIKDVLKLFGIAVGPKDSVKFNKGILTVTTTEENHDRLTSLLRGLYTSEEIKEMDRAKRNKTIKQK